MIDQLTKQVQLGLYKNSVSMKQFLKFFIQHHRFPKKDLFFWPHGLLLHSLKTAGTDDTYKLILDDFKKWESQNFRISSFDDALSVYVFMSCQELLEKKKVSLLAEHMLSYLSDFRNQAIPYKKQEKDYIYIDLLGMVCPFLCQYGVINHSPEIIDWGLSQFELFFEHGKDSKYGYLYHGYSLATSSKMGIHSWGRGYGWMLFGLIEVASILLEYDNVRYQKVVQYYLSVIQETLLYQKEDGGFSWQLSAMDGQTDTSATAMILYSMLQARKLGIIDQEYDSQIQKAILLLSKFVQDGKVYSCSSECGGFGIYPQVFGSYPWSIAPTLSCLKVYGDIYE